MTTSSTHPLHFHSELHLHLYGCVSAATLWDLGKNVWKKQRNRLEWYASEYAKAYGFVPDFAAYWQSDRGYQQLRTDFEFIDPAPFHCFQARFNLLIALLPITPTDGSVLTRVLADLQASGIRYAEIRFVLPLSFSASEAAAYLDLVTTIVEQKDLETEGSFIPRLALSLPRQDDLLWRHYGWLRTFLRQKPEKAPFIVAVDFSHYEEGFPPRDKAAFFARLNADNAHETPLAVLYHVGESFNTMTIMSAARWVYEAHQLGAHRLGHAIALGLEPENLLGQSVSESVAQRHAHLTWLQQESTWLKAYGYERSNADIAAELAALPNNTTDTLNFTYDHELTADARSLQEAIIRRMVEQKAIIESCPTSNFRIGQIQNSKLHPLPRFLKAGMEVIVSTDDPGIFAIDLASEEDICRQVFELSEEQLAAIARRSEQTTARALTQRG